MSIPIAQADAIYWNRLRKGDVQALAFFYDKYVDKMELAALRVTRDKEQVKDAIQEVFVEIWNYRETLGDIKFSQSYLTRVVQNILVKKLKLCHQTYLMTAESVLFIEENQYEKIIDLQVEGERIKKLQAALSTLTDRQQEVIKLRFYEGLSYEEIATKMQMNYQSVNNLVFRSMLSLRRRMNNQSSKN